MRKKVNINLLHKLDKNVGFCYFLNGILRVNCAYYFSCNRSCNCLRNIIGKKTRIKRYAVTAYRNI